jgi:hypothetical protein
MLPMLSSIEPTALVYSFPRNNLTYHLDSSMADWNGRLEWWTGMVDWNGGLEWWTGMVDWNGVRNAELEWQTAVRFCVSYALID